LPPELERLKVRQSYGSYSDEQVRAFLHVALLLASPLVYLLATWVISAGSSGYLIEAPAPGGLAYLPIAAALLLFLCLKKAKDVLVAPLRWLALAGWLAVVAGSLLYAGLGLAARAAATAGPALRALPVSEESHGRTIRIQTTRFSLQDGSSATVTSSSGFAVGRSCYLVHRMQGSRGFAWLRIVDWSPGPGPGQLAWPIDRDDCFSAADLSTLGR
jgi:hypothetical protein